LEPLRHLGETMGFIKNRIIYERGKTKVYINQCHNPGKRTNLYTIRRDDKQGFAWILGIIKFDGAWRQYVTEFEPNTKWSAGCKEEIAKFEREINKKWRKKFKGGFHNHGNK
jgi:hypothetical protein